MTRLMIATAALALAAGSALAQDVVRIGTEGAYPPYNYLDDAGEVAGFERELGDELCSRAGLTCEWVLVDWDSIIPNLTSGNYDVILAGMTVTEEREAVIDFTQDYYPPTASAYVATNPDVDVNDAVVAAQTATIQAAHVAKSGATLLEFANPEETVASVRNGEADAVLADYDYLKPAVDASGGELVFVGDPVPLGGGIAMGLRQSDAELRAAFDEAISSMKTDGSLNDLLVKWFGEETTIYE